MNNLKRIACLAAFALLATPAIAASGPADVPMPGPMVPAIEAVADDAATMPNVCMFAIVEDAATCTITIAAISGRCPIVIARVIEAMGPATIGSPSFVGACVAPAPATPPD